LRRDTFFDNARDELFAHVNRCNVLKASEEQQREWMEDTMDYMSERFPGLTPEQLGELREIGLRFCKPVIPHGKGNTALTAPAATEQTEAEMADVETAGVETAEVETSDDETLVGAA